MHRWNRASSPRVLLGVVALGLIAASPASAVASPAPVAGETRAKAAPAPAKPVLKPKTRLAAPPSPAGKAAAKPPQGPAQRGALKAPPVAAKAKAAAVAPTPAPAKVARPIPAPKPLLLAPAPVAARPAPAVTAARTPSVSDPVSTGSLGTPASPQRPAVATEAPSLPFARFVEQLWPDAHARGVSRATFDAAFEGVVADPKIAEMTTRQSEFVKPIWDYLETAVTDARIEKGREAAAQWSAELARAESRYGVDRSVILGIWGMETNFGSFTGGKDVIRSLATLAQLNYRGTFFRDELLTALVILQQGHVAREDMKGSWAGAMGQTQFMPSSFMKYAVDADGDGHKNIWTSMPDAIASTAHYLAEHGWTRGLPWGVEVSIPERFDWRTREAGFHTWAGLGFRRTDGKAMPRSGEATLFLPAGSRGPAFLVTSNFTVIKRYNASDAYAMGVGHLGDRISGGAALAAQWPTDARPLNKDQRFEIQRHLLRMGYDVGEPDGRFGAKTRDAVRDFQERRGLVPDGYADVALLETLRQTR